MRKVLSTAREIESFYKKDLEDLIKSFDIPIKICINDQVRFNENNTTWDIYLDNSDNPVRLSTPTYIDLGEFNRFILNLTFKHCKKSLTNEEGIRMIDKSNDLIKNTNIINRYHFIDGTPLPVTFDSMFEIKTEEEPQESTNVNHDEEFSDLETLQALASDIVINKYLNTIIDKFNHINPNMFTMSYRLRRGDNKKFEFNITGHTSKSNSRFILNKEDICLEDIKEFAKKSVIRKNNATEENIRFFDEFDKIMDDLILDSYVDYTNPYIARRRKYYSDDNYTKLTWNNFIINIIDTYNGSVISNKFYVKNQIKVANCFGKIEKIVMDDDLYEFEENIFEGYISPYGLVIIIGKDKVTVAMVSSISKSYVNNSINSADFVYQINVPYQLFGFISEYNDALDMIFIKMMKAIKLDQK